MDVNGYPLVCLVEHVAPTLLSLLSLTLYNHYSCDASKALIEDIVI